MKFAVFDEIKYLQTNKVILMQDLTQLLNILTKPAKKLLRNLLMTILKLKELN